MTVEVVYISAETRNRGLALVHTFRRQRHGVTYEAVYFELNADDAAMKQQQVIIDITFFLGVACEGLGLARKQFDLTTGVSCLYTWPVRVIDRGGGYFNIVMAAISLMGVESRTKDSCC